MPRPRPVYLDAADIPRLARATRETLGQPRATVKPPGAAMIMAPIRVMKVTQQVSIATSAGPGVGKGRFVAVTFADDDTATYGDPEGDEVPLYSIDTGNPTTVGKVVIVATLSGRQFVIVETC